MLTIIINHTSHQLVGNRAALRFALEMILSGMQWSSIDSCAFAYDGKSITGYEIGIGKLIATSGVADFLFGESR